MNRKQSEDTIQLLARKRKEDSEGEIKGPENPKVQ